MSPTRNLGTAATPVIEGSFPTDGWVSRKSGPGLPRPTGGLPGKAGLYNIGSRGRRARREPRPGHAAGTGPEPKRVAHARCWPVRLSKAATPTRAQWVYEQLKEAILSGALEPGERLVVDQLARDFGTSPIPVREAIRRLEAEELVETTPYIGARVAPVRADQLEELMAIRKELEPLLARTAVLGATPEAIDELEDLVRRMDEVAYTDQLAYSRLNYEF